LLAAVPVAILGAVVTPTTTAHAQDSCTFNLTLYLVSPPSGESGLQVVGSSSCVGTPVVMEGEVQLYYEISPGSSTLLFQNSCGQVETNYDQTSCEQVPAAPGNYAAFYTTQLFTTDGSKWAPTGPNPQDCVGYGTSALRCTMMVTYTKSSSPAATQ